MESSPVTTNITAEISKDVFLNMSLFSVKSGLKKKEIVELALIEFLEKHDSK